MSVINQMLQDLDRRRASLVERDVIPHNVRVLPHVDKRTRTIWIAAGTSAAIALGTFTWYFMRHAAQPRHADLFDAQVAAIPAVRLEPPKPRVEEAAPVSAARAPLPTSAVVARETATTPVTQAPPPLEAAPARTEPAVEAAPAEPPRVKAPPPPPPARAIERRAEPAQAPAQIEKRAPQLTPRDIAENEYRDGANLLNQGRAAEAQQKFRNALQQQPSHIGARQALLGLMLQSKKMVEAEQLLQDALQLDANQAGFAMMLARLQVDRGEMSGAVETLRRTAPSAAENPDYLAFLAALLQRQGRHADAVDHYNAALALAPRSGVWLMGLGISLQALNRSAEARDAYRRALATNALNPELQAFVSERLRQLQ